MAGERPRVVLVSEIARLGRGHLVALEERFELVARHDLDNVADDGVLAAGLDGAWAVVAGAERYSERLLRLLPSLRLIARAGVGFDAIDVDAATRHGVLVTTTPDANADAVADLALALVLACLRRLPLGDRSVRAGGWRPDGLGGDLAGATVGVVGLGRIGRKVVERLRGFGCRVLAHEPQPDVEFCSRHGVRLLELDELLPQVDVLTLHAPLTPSTRGLIGADELASLKQTAILVNTARGGLVDEEALVAALREGALGGAALDVFAREPLPPDHPLRAFENVLLSPHVASYTRGSVARMLAAVSTTLEDAAAGRVPPGCINPDAPSP